MQEAHCWMSAIRERIAVQRHSHRHTIAMAAYLFAFSPTMTLSCYLEQEHEICWWQQTYDWMLCLWILDQQSFILSHPSTLWFFLTFILSTWWMICSMAQIPINHNQPHPYTSCDSCEADLMLYQLWTPDWAMSLPPFGLAMAKIQPNPLCLHQWQPFFYFKS